jgi:hypothetical protein
MASVPAFVPAPDVLVALTERRVRGNAVLTFS